MGSRRDATMQSASGVPEAPSVEVVVVTQSDPFFTGRFLETFLDACIDLPVCISQIILLPNFGESSFSLARRFLRFYGMVDFVRLAARYVRSRFSDRWGSPRSVEAIAARHGIGVRRCTDINDDRTVQGIRERDPDIILSVASPQIFRRGVLHAAPLVLNVHSGRLPQYRGMMPTFWALRNGERDIAVTVHRMVERIDAGDIIAEFPVSIQPHDSAFELSARAKAVAGQEVARLLARMSGAAPTAIRTPDLSAGRYYRFPSRDDAKRLRAMGRALL